MLFWRNILVFTFYLNWIPFQNKIITQTGTLTLGSPVWPHSLLLLTSSLRVILWVMDCLRMVTHFIPQVKLYVTLPSLAPFSYCALKSSQGPSQEVGEPLRAHSSLISMLPLLTVLTLSCQFLMCCPNFASCPLSSPALPSQGVHLRVLSE